MMINVTPILVYLGIGFICMLGMAILQILRAKEPHPNMVGAVGTTLLILPGWAIFLVFMIVMAVVGYVQASRALLCGHCHQTFKDDAAMRAHLITCVKNPLVMELSNAQSTIETMTDILNELWGLLYPDKTSWDYPGEVLNHIRVELERRKGQLQGEKTDAGAALVILTQISEMIVGAGFKPSQAGEEADSIAWREGIEWLRVELQAMTILRNAHKETCSCVAFHPRAWRLMHERKPFVVVANDEPYFPSVYGMIRAREKEKERWTGVDEINYLKAMSEYGFQHPPQPAPDSK